MRPPGYTRHVAQCGDQGAAVTDALGRQAPDGLLRIHLNLLRTAPAGGASQPAESEEEGVAADAIATFRTSGFGYFLEQSTRPQTIGYALLDPPVARAACLLDPGHGQLPEDLPCLPRRPARGPADPGPDRRQRHHVLPDRHRASAARSYWENG
jgi:hypothetical protein